MHNYVFKGDKACGRPENVGVFRPELSGVEMARLCCCDIAGSVSRVAGGEFSDPLYATAVAQV